METTYRSCPCCCVFLEDIQYLTVTITNETRKTINCPNCSKSITFDGQTKHWWPKVNKQ